MSLLRKNLTRFIVLGILILLMGVSIPLYMYFSHNVSELVDHYPHIVRDGKKIDYVIKKSLPKDWIRLANISKPAKWAIIFSEDWAFYGHDGLDLEQMKVALSEMVEEKRFRGASTISQQMVKNVYLSHERSLWRKLHELILTFKVERVLHKQRILEIYLNCIEYGPGIYGIRQASNHYFNKHPSELSPREGAFLAMLLPSPKKYYISFKKKGLTAFAQKRVNTILKKLKMGKVITPAQLQLEQASRFFWEKNTKAEEANFDNGPESLSSDPELETGELIESVDALDHAP